jgi:hypothetical protein
MKRLILTTCLFVLFASCTALADWNEGDPYKMHFPQMPDPCGWDVGFYTRVPQLADDWQCTESGEVDDVHMWYSWKDDLVGTIEMVQLSIWSNNPGGETGAAAGYSTPDEQLWGYQNLYPGDFTTRLWGKANQGWYDPVSGEYETNDHVQIFQLNIEDIADPFYQEAGEIYWLSVCFYIAADQSHAGWKTADVDSYPDPYTGSHFMDDAVWYDGENWNRLLDPISEESLDLAFVITPEPATLSLLGLGSLVMLRKRRA